VAALFKSRRSIAPAKNVLPLIVEPLNVEQLAMWGVDDGYGSDD
jgi:hypothetical protein